MQPAVFELPSPTLATWVSCTGCGLMQKLPPPKRLHRRTCPRCHTSFGSGIADPQVALAYAATALLLFVLAQFFPLMGMELEGRANSIHLASGVEGLVRHDFPVLAIVVLCICVLVPVVRIAAMVYVLVGIHMRTRPPHLLRIFRLAEELRQWAMLDVALLGALIAFSKLRKFAFVSIGLGFWGLGGVVLVLVFLETAFDRQAIWDLLYPPLLLHSKPEGEGWIGCDTCRLLQEVPDANSLHHCARCDSTLHRRKPDSITRTWALVVAGFILYIPANLYPVMTVISFGKRTTSTILSGVHELIVNNDWPLAAIVFVASIIFPLLKLFSLSWMMLAIRRRSVRRLTARSRLYRIIEFVGRWSNIDVFVTALLAGLVTLGNIATVEPENGIFAFGAVVVVTMLATDFFDPRLSWDAAEAEHAG